MNRILPGLAMLLGVYLVLSFSTASGQNYKVGDQVVVIEDAELKSKVSGKTIVDEFWPGLVLTVTNIKDQWLRVSNGQSGWLNQSKVIQLNRQAIVRMTVKIKADPRNDLLYNGRADVWKHLGEQGSAIEDLGEAIRLNPLAAYYTNRGSIWNDDGNYDRAIKDFNEAIRLDPVYSWSYGNRGDAWKHKGEFNKAIQDYSEVIRLEPKFAGGYNSRGNAWKSIGKYDKAIDDYNQAILIKPTSAGAYKNRGSAWSNKGEYDDAISDYQKTIELEPNLAFGHNALAWLLATCPDSKYRDGEKAIATATKACALTAWKNADFIDTLAAAYAESGDFNNAVKWQLKVIEILPERDKDDYKDSLRLYQSGKPYHQEKR